MVKLPASLSNFISMVSAVSVARITLSLQIQDKGSMRHCRGTATPKYACLQLIKCA